MAIWLAIAASLGLAAVAAAETPPIEIRRAEIGYGGSYKSGFVTPVWLTLRSARDVRGVVEIISPDGDGVPVAFSAASSGRDAVTDLRSNTDHTICVYVKVGPESSTLSVRLRDPSTQVMLWKARFPASTPPPLPATAELILSLGDLPSVADAAALIPRSGNQRVIAAKITDAAHVPDDWWGLEGVETIVVSTGTGNVVEKLSPNQSAALRSWVEFGGRLVICVGERGQELLTAGSLLADLVPGKLVDVSPLRDLNKLGELTGHGLVVPANGARPLVAHVAVDRGRIEDSVSGLAGEVPLLTRASYGFGEVVLLCLDPDVPVLRDWPGRGRLLLPALVASGKHSSTVQAPRRNPSRLGYDDLSGQLRVALDDFPQVRVVNLTTVAILTLAYLALIGPIDFFVLRRLRWPGMITWISFPLLVGAFCTLGWYAARASHGTEVTVNQCEVIDIDMDRQLVRGTTWLHVYSPKTETYDLALALDPKPIRLTPPAEGWISWQGLPGNGLGGLAANQLTAPRLSPYQVSFSGPKLTLSGMPVQIAGSKALSARWWGACSMPQPPPLTINQFGLLEGEIVNPLPVELSDCLLVYDEWMYRLKTLSPGQRVRVADHDPLNLEARLQQRTVANAKDIISPWERDATDVPRIVQMLMFHESARGSAYTNLTHRYLSYLDLTPRVRNGRAVLVGRMPQAVTHVSLSGETLSTDSRGEPWSWVRIVIPISPRPGEQPRK